MIKRALLGFTLVALLSGSPATAMAVTTPTPSPTASAPAALGPARDAAWKKAGAHSATLTWKAPANAAKRKVQYVVIVKIKLGDAKATTRTESGYTKTSITYTGIPAGAKLTGEVTVSTRYAMGNHDKVPTYTQAQLKPSQVQDARLVATGVQLKASWKAPKNDDGTLINGYRATLYKVPETSSEKLDAVVRVDLKASQTTRTFTNLQGESQYYVFIQAKNSKGLGQRTQTNVATTGVVPETQAPEPADTPTPTPSVTTPTAAPTISPGESVAPGVTVPPQVKPTAATPEPTASPGANVETTGIGTLSQASMKLLVVGGLVLVLGAVGFAGWRLYRRYF